MVALSAALRVVRIWILRKNSECSAPKCSKQIHPDCFVVFLEKNCLKKLDGGAFICGTKSCYNKIRKQISQEGELNVCWDCDG